VPAAAGAGTARRGSDAPSAVELPWRVTGVWSVAGAEPAEHRGPAQHARVRAEHVQS
jgi:hypothetical protein